MSFIKKFKNFQNWFKLRSFVILFITFFVSFTVRFLFVNYFHLDMSIFMEFYLLGLLVSFLRAIVTDSVDIVILSYFKPLVCEEIDGVVEKYDKKKLKVKGRDKNKGKMKAIENHFSKLDSNLYKFNIQVISSNIKLESYLKHVRYSLLIPNEGPFNYRQLRIFLDSYTYTYSTGNKSVKFSLVIGRSNIKYSPCTDTTHISFRPKSGYSKNSDFIKFKPIERDVHKQPVPKISIIPTESSVKHMRSLSPFIPSRSCKVKGLSINDKNSVNDYKQFISKPLYNSEEKRSFKNGRIIDYKFVGKNSLSIDNNTNS